jgi:hypothetical protein
MVRRGIASIAVLVDVFSILVQTYGLIAIHECACAIDTLSSFSLFVCLACQGYIE